MFIPPNKLKDNFQANKKDDGQVRLKASHLLIDHKVATTIFGKELSVNLIYYADRKTLMVAPQSDDLFKKLHKAKKYMLKERNARGDKAITLQELMIDHEINSMDRTLAFELQIPLNILKITL